MTIILLIALSIIAFGFYYETRGLRRKLTLARRVNDELSEELNSLKANPLRAVADAFANFGAAVRNGFQDGKQPQSFAEAAAHVKGTVHGARDLSSNPKYLAPPTDEREKFKGLIDENMKLKRRLANKCKGFHDMRDLRK